MVSEKATAAVITLLAAGVIGVVAFTSYKTMFSVGNDPFTSAPTITEPKLKYLSWYEPDEKSAEYKAYAELLGAAEGEELFEYTNVSYRDRYTKLEQLIKSGDSPDIFPFERSIYPMSVSKGYFKQLDEFIDFNNEIWLPTRDISEQLKWNGSNYCAVVKSRPAAVLWYRRSVIEQCGLDDPYELYKSGSWTLAEFSRLTEEFMSQSGGALYGIDGYDTGALFSAACGVPVVSLNGGVAVNNAGNEAFTRIMTTLGELGRKGVCYPYFTSNNGTPDYSAWANGKTLFFADKINRYEKTWIMFRSAKGWSNDEIVLVPMPCDENADDYYYSAEPVGYMLCSGSENVYAFRRFVSCAVTAYSVKSAVESHNEIMKSRLGLSEKLLSRIQRIGDNERPVVDLHNGVVSAETTMGISGKTNPYGELFKGTFYYGEDYVKLFENNSSQLDSVLAQTNPTTSAK